MIVLESKYVTTFVFALLCSVPACVSACVCGTPQTGNAPELVFTGRTTDVVRDTTPDGDHVVRYTFEVIFVAKGDSPKTLLIETDTSDCGAVFEIEHTYRVIARRSAYSEYWTTGSCSGNEEEDAAPSPRQRFGRQPRASAPTGIRSVMLSTIDGVWLNLFCSASSLSVRPCPVLPALAQAIDRVMSGPGIKDVAIGTTTSNCAQDFEIGAVYEVFAVQSTGDGPSWITEHNRKIDLRRKSHDAKGRN